MWPRTEPDSVVDALSVLSDAGIVFADFSAAQSTAEGFFLVGTVHFNEAQVDFDEGYCRFLLRSARVQAIATDSIFDYSSIAYVHTPKEEADSDVTVLRDSTKKRSKSASAMGCATLSLKSGFGLGGELGGKLTGDYEVSTARTEGVKSTERRMYVRADVFAHGNDPDQIVWTISPDPANPLHQDDKTYDVVHGRRLNKANEGAGLAYVRMTSEGGGIDLSLYIRASEIVWTSFEFPGTSKLHKFKKRLINGRTKQEVIGRIALAKAFEGSIPLKRLP
ncbi:MAG: hypothetical protein Tsb0032_25100 [Kiloniellaceae bacterium]